MAWMRILGRLRVDPYLPLLIGTIGLASLFPARGVAADVVSVATNVAIGTLFFLYGARLTTQTIVQGIIHWRLQLVVLASTFVLFPLIGEGALALSRGWLDRTLVMGLVFVSLLPSTIQSSIAFTSIARGNVPAAMCCASLSNVIGVVITPILTAVLLSGRYSSLDFGGLKDIFLQLLAPFGLGQLARPWVGGWISRRKRIGAVFDRGSILLVVYKAFGAGMVAGVWRRIDASSLLGVTALDLLMLGLVLVSTTFVSRALRFDKEDEITIVFCGSKKSLASGIPMANILFPPQAAGLVVIPLMIFHQAQLFACAILAQRYSRRRELSPAAALALVEKRSASAG